MATTDNIYIFVKYLFAIYLLFLAFFKIKFCLPWGSDHFLGIKLILRPKVWVSPLINIKQFFELTAIYRKNS